MEKIRRKRSTITAVTDRIPTDSLSNECVFRGNRRGRRNLLNPASDSSSCSGGIMDEDSFASECNLKPSKQAYGASVKNLLAKEMAGEIEYKRRSPSIIAKLMGLDGLPPEQTTQRRQKKVSENFSGRFSFLKKAQRTCTFDDSQYSRRNSEQEYKDVFEVWEMPKVESSSYSSRKSEKFKLDESEMDFIRQKFLDAKRLSTDENFQHSKELHDALEILDTNKDLLLKLLQQPDSLFTQHLKDLQFSLPHSSCRSIKSTESTDILKREKMDDFGPKAKRENLHRSHSKSRQKKKHCDGSFCRCESNHAGGNSMIEGKDDVTIQPTKIVVLKPNIGKAKNGADIGLQPCSSRDFHSYCRKHIEFSGRKHGNFDLSGERKMSSDVQFCRRNYRESREIAKLITRQMRSSMSADSTKSSLFGLERCPMKENSARMPMFESSNELNMGVVDSSLSINLLNRSGPSSSCSKESPVSWEAKKRLSERWKMTHNSRKMEIVNRGSTLADMLASHDKETVAALSDGGIRVDGFCNKFPNDDDPSELVEPLGISSRDGWKGECIGKLTRSRSLPASTTALRIPKTRHIPDARCTDRYLVRKEVLKHEWKETVEGRFVTREGSVHRNSRTRHRKSHSYGSIENHDITLEAHTGKSQVQINFPENEAHEKDLLISETSPCFTKDKSSGPKTMVYESLGELDGLEHKDQPSETSKDNTVQLHPGHEIETPILLKESNQPSPVSVLDQPFTDDLSSCSDYFESLSADLHGLRMQLQLLKLESEAYAEGPILPLGDGDFEEDLTGFSNDHKLLHRESWEMSYLTDVLNHSALDDTDLDMFFATWHSPDCPIDPTIFEELEKKWSYQAQKKYERRLLFDRINAGICKLYQQFTVSRPWVRQLPMNQLKCRWIKGGLHEDLLKLVANQEKEVKKDSVGKEVGRENQWLNFGDEVDALGREIERLLMDDLVAEVDWSCSSLNISEMEGSWTTKRN